VCDIPYDRELQITVAQPPARLMEKPDKLPIVPVPDIRDISWQLTCDLPANRELIVNLSPARRPRANANCLSIARCIIKQDFWRGPKQLFLILARQQAFLISQAAPRSQE